MEKIDQLQTVGRIFDQLIPNFHIAEMLLLDMLMC